MTCPKGKWNQQDWEAFVQGVQNFLANQRAENYAELVYNMLEAFQLMSTRMSVEMHVYISHLNQITEMSSISMGKYVVKIQKWWETDIRELLIWAWWENTVACPSNIFSLELKWQECALTPNRNIKTNILGEGKRIDWIVWWCSSQKRDEQMWVGLLSLAEMFRSEASGVSAPEKAEVLRRLASTGVLATSVFEI